MSKNEALEIKYIYASNGDRLSDTIIDIESQINKAIKEGWEMSGDTIVMGSARDVLVQKMIKKPDPNKYHNC